MNQWITQAAGAAALACCTAAIAQSAPGGSQATTESLRREVVEVERAFARSMADRDASAFAGFVSPEAVFFSGPVPLRGKEQVVAYWARYFAAPDAPFSWEPADVEVLASGTLALSSGPVHDRAGKPLGRFTSIWRLEAPGRWRIVFDKGEARCDCAKPQPRQ